MTRGRRDRSEEREAGLTRRCIATGQSLPRDGLIRFVAAPDGIIVPDLAEKLPGRGAWVCAERSALSRAFKKGLLLRALGPGARLAANEGTPLDSLERNLLRRCIESVALARKAGAAVCGFERVRESLLSGNVALLFSAFDGAEGGKSKLRGLADGVETSSALSSAELGLAFGRETVIHASLLDGGVTRRAVREAQRLSALRGEMALQS